MIGGLGAGINSASTIAVLSSYKEERDIYIGIFEMACGLGILVGPLLGTALFSMGGI